MNITKFINSKSVAKYLDEIGYKFNSLEAAYLVWQSRFTAIEEKFVVWQEIIDAMPDLSVKKQHWNWTIDEPSLHAFLKRYIQLQKGYIESFYKQDNCLYTYQVLFEGDRDWYIDERIFNSLKPCEKAVEEEMKDDDVKFYSIKKQVPNGGDSIELIFNKNGVIYDIYAVESNNLGEEVNDPDRLFEGFWYKFPTPFKRGDIVYQGNQFVYWGTQKKEPFVLLDISCWGEEELRENGVTDEEKIASKRHIISLHKKEGDESDMNANGYFVDDRGRTYWNHTTDSYLNLEYYDGELKGESRFLIALSNYEKKKIGLERLLNAYKVYCDRLSEEHVLKYAYFTEEELKLTGLK